MLLVTGLALAMLAGVQAPPAEAGHRRAAVIAGLILGGIALHEITRDRRHRHSHRSRSYYRYDDHYYRNNHRRHHRNRYRNYGSNDPYYHLDHHGPDK